MNCAKESYCLNKQRVNCIYNGLLKNREIEDLDISFNDGRKTILAVASPWSTEKGLDFIHYIDSKLDYTKFRLIVVGLKIETCFFIPLEKVFIFLPVSSPNPVVILSNLSSLKSL